MKILQKGDVATLFHYKDDLKNHFYTLSPSNKIPQELIYSMYTTKSYVKVKTVEDYKNQLFQIAQRENIYSEELTFMIKKAAYVNGPLIDVVRKINALAEKINVLSFKGDPEASYTLVVKKNGYANYTTTFNYKSFMASNGDSPLKVILEKIPTVTMNVVSSPNFGLYFTASGTITVDWGDGKTEPIDLNYAAPTEKEPRSDLKSLVHDYSDHLDHTVNITGDLPLINELKMQGVTSLSALDLSDLTEIETIELHQSDFDTLNISRNNKLKAVILSDRTSSIKSIKFSPRNNINYIQLDNVGDMDNILREVYNNVVANNIHGGRIIGNFDSKISKEIQTMIKDFNWTAN